jgi:hypothetical protein
MFVDPRWVWRITPVSVVMPIRIKGNIISHMVLYMLALMLANLFCQIFKDDTVSISVKSC